MTDVTTPISPAPMPSAAARPPAWLMLGMPDNAVARLLFTAWNEPPRIVMQGTASFLGQLHDLPWSPQAVYFGKPGMAINTQLARLPCINFMADADLYLLALRQAAEFVQLMDVPCFNHPHAVLRSTRDGVWQALKDVAGLHVPVTVRAKATTADGLRQAMAEAGIHYPVLVRMTGDHGGVSTAKVDGDDGWDAINGLPWGGREVYLTQFVDYRDEDGRYRKTRLVVAGGAVLTRHLLVSDDWMVHLKERDARFEAQERAWMESFGSVTAPKISGTVLEMARRLGLDYFGIDASLRPDGSLLLFEANACMNVLLPPPGKAPTMWDAQLALITSNLTAILGNCRAWRGQP
jgi:glutathione synthase/RimK-type ligase-like ATP-grasp enzyme